MEQDDENKKGDHQDQGSDRGFDSKKRNETSHADVRSSGGLLQRTGIDESLGIDIGIENKQQVIAVGEIHQE